MRNYPDQQDDTYPRNSYGDDGEDGGVLDVQHIHQEAAWGEHPYLNGGIFQAIIDRYWAKGEHGIIYTDNRSPYRVIKVANLDITDSEGNWNMANFLKDNWKKDIEGLVNIHSYWSGTCDGFHYQLIDKIKKTSKPLTVNKAIATLDLAKGDEVMFIYMELLPYVGLSHPDLTVNEMIRRVAEAATNISMKTGHILSDIVPSNYGFRQDGSAAIFDFVASFNYEDDDEDLEKAFGKWEKIERGDLFDFYGDIVRRNAKV